MKPIALDGEDVRILQRIQVEHAKLDPETATDEERVRFQKLLNMASVELLSYVAEIVSPGSAPRYRFASDAEAEQFFDDQEFRPDLLTPD